MPLDPNMLQAWDGLVSPLRSDIAELNLIAPLQRSVNGGSGAFMALASDGNRYWVKPTNNGQGELVPVTEQVVARVGALIGAPVCGVKTIYSPPGLTFEYRRGLRLEPGIHHASLAVDNVFETRNMGHFSDDDNRSRHVGYAALYDLCWGSDEQWLISVDEDNSYFSHDHGWFLPPPGPNWTRTEMLASDAQPKEFRGRITPYSSTAVERLATRLRGLTRTEILTAITAIPSSWSVSDADLEAAGYFVEVRAPLVADRLEQRFPPIT